MIPTQIVNIHPMNTRHATDTKNCESIEFLPVITSTAPLIVCTAITDQWKMNIDILSDIKMCPMAGSIEKMMNKQS
jgi:hypothetical protein